MKITIKSIIAIALIAIMGISCQKEAVGPIPGAIERECKAGDKPTISFSVAGDWKLSSDQVWCKFVTSGGELQEMAGGTGQHVITLKITDENNGNQWSTANITMKKDGKQGIIAKIKRHPKELYIKLYDVTDTPIKTFKIGYEDWVPTRIEGNFRYAATEIPEWIEVATKHEDGTIEITNSITGAPGEAIEVLTRIVNDGERERQKITAEDGYVIEFSDEEGLNKFEFAIVYDGMGTDKLTFVGPTSGYYGWDVSLDGKTFRYTDPTNNTATTFSDELEYTITAQDNLYNIIYFEKVISRGVAEYKYFEETNQNSWMHFNKERMALTIDEHNGHGPRFGMVMALPTKIYNTIRASVLESIFESDASSGIALPIVKEDYTRFILIEFTQRDFADRGEYEGMDACHSLTTLDIYCAPHTDAALTEKYGTEDIYICDFVNYVEGKRAGVIVDPRIENWTTANYEAGNIGAEVWLGDKQLKISEGEYYLGENTDERMAIHLWGPNDKWNDQNMVVVFTVSDIAKKILVVTPPAVEAM